MGFFTSALLCLAANIYHESRGEPVDGQIAVAQVTLNRVASERYPDTVCAVVFQRKQFSWTHDKQSDLPADLEAWQLAVFIAGHMNQFDDLTSGATHFYAPSKVSPPWEDQLTLIGQIGNHRFMLEN